MISEIFCCSNRDMICSEVFFNVREGSRVKPGSKFARHLLSVKEVVFEPFESFKI